LRNQPKTGRGKAFCGQKAKFADESGLKAEKKGEKSKNIIAGFAEKGR
jgi:hypothetical protein